MDWRLRLKTVIRPGAAEDPRYSGGHGGEDSDLGCAASSPAKVTSCGWVLCMKLAAIGCHRRRALTSLHMGREAGRNHCAELED
jgi:hypothetical protein